MGNKTRNAVVATIAIVACGLVAACGALNLGDIIPARTPLGVQRTTGLPGSIPVNQAKAEYEAWVLDTQRHAAEWRESIAGADTVVAFIGDLGMSTLEEYGLPAVAAAGLGGAIPLLTLFAGKFLMRRPGDVPSEEVEALKALYESKIAAAWDESRRQTLDDAAAGKAIATA